MTGAPLVTDVPPGSSGVSSGTSSGTSSGVPTEYARPRSDEAFRALRVARVERLCDDAVAITFEVPDELGETYAFRPGQYLTLRKHTDAGEERRSYSICAP